MDQDMAGAARSAPRQAKEAIAESPDFSAPSWRKSTFSMGNGNCVELARLRTGHVAVRDSKSAPGPVLLFTPREWRTFVGGVKRGEFDRFG